jgi:hypothetical protein
MRDFWVVCLFQLKLVANRIDKSLSDAEMILGKISIGEENES